MIGAWLAHTRYSSAGTCCGGATFSYSVVMDACYIPSLNKIVVALSNGKIQLYTKDASAITGQLSSYWSGSQFYGHSGGSGINALALVDDTNGYMASGGADNRVIIWDVPNSLVKYRLTGHADQAYGLKFWSASNYLGPETELCAYGTPPPAHSFARSPHPTQL